MPLEAQMDNIHGVEEESNLHDLLLVEASVVLQGLCPERTLPQREASSVHSASSHRRRIGHHHTVVHQRELSKEVYRMLKLHPPYTGVQNDDRTGTEDVYEQNSSSIFTCSSALPAAFANRSRKWYGVGTVRFHSMLFRIAFSAARIWLRLNAPSAIWIKSFTCATDAFFFSSI
jgi:hypothetical protein